MHSSGRLESSFQENQEDFADRSGNLSHFGGLRNEKRGVVTTTQHLELMEGICYVEERALEEDTGNVSLANLGATLSPFILQPVLIPGIDLTHVQDLAVGLVELHKVHTGPPHKPVKVSLDGTPSLQRVHHTTELDVGNFLEGSFNPPVRVTNKDVKEGKSQYRPLKNVSCHWSPLEHQAVDRNSLSVTISRIPYPPSALSVKSMSLQFRDQDVMQDCVKCFAHIQADAVNCYSLIRQCHNPILEGHQICQA
ncbi:hypothetical protein llap_9625 [Limosa lapponica baueri]|uniref:Uncharacterized protein n=1 Tax=Limosa lapponica baueri TaxID=1758121 RepID=A0A2I0U1X6_LIMLA|nr:hypothetical protein llap_9625 [Limosa lapponica baueri]